MASWTIRAASCDWGDAFSEPFCTSATVTDVSDFVAVLASSLPPEPPQATPPSSMADNAIPVTKPLAGAIADTSPLYLERDPALGVPLIAVYRQGQDAGSPGRSHGPFCEMASAGHARVARSGHIAGHFAPRRWYSGPSHGHGMAKSDDRGSGRLPGRSARR